jgi:hypothetical protein
MTISPNKHPPTILREASLPHCLVSYPTQLTIYKYFFAHVQSSSCCKITSQGRKDPPGRNFATEFNPFLIRFNQKSKIEKGGLPKIGAIFNKNTTVPQKSNSSERAVLPTRSKQAATEVVIVVCGVCTKLSESVSYLFCCSLLVFDVCCVCVFCRGPLSRWSVVARWRFFWTEFIGFNNKQQTKQAAKQLKRTLGGRA